MAQENSGPHWPSTATIDDFTVDHDNRIATCPNGLTRPISRTGIATFGMACLNCPLRAGWTRSRDGKGLKVTGMTHASAPRGGWRAARTGWPTTASAGP